MSCRYFSKYFYRKGVLKIKKKSLLNSEFLKIHILTLLEFHEGVPRIVTLQKQFPIGLFALYTLTVLNREEQTNHQS